jgi:excisionase family DNA binding protein
VHTKVNEATGARERLVTREELAVALKVSLRTVDRMIAGGEIESIRVRGRVRFYLPDVVRQLIATALTRKRGRNAQLHTVNTDFNR